MAIIDVVKCEANSQVLVEKFPSNDLRLGTQLVVHTGQVAFFVKGGKVMDMFESGTYTIKTSNIPILGKLINLPFGGNSPFQAEVWFVNKLAVLDTKWGTPTPIQLEDPKYDIIVPVRSFGQYGLKVHDPRMFLEKLVGNMSKFTVAKVDSYFKGIMMSLYANLISDKMTKANISVLNINSHLLEMSEYVCEKLKPEFEKYGLTLENFAIMSINVPEDDPSYIKLKEAKDLAAKVKIAGRDLYQMERTFDVMDKAAGNEGVGGQMLGLGVGLGAGAGVGNQIGNAVAQTMNTNPAPPPASSPVAPPAPAAAPAPPPIQMATYFLAVNGQQYGPYDENTMNSMIKESRVNGDTMAWKEGMEGWAKLSTFTEFAQLLPAQAPPAPIAPAQVTYLVIINGQQYGPYDESAIKEMLGKNQIYGDALTWRPGMASWEKLSSLPEFASLFSLPEPPANPT